MEKNLNSGGLTPSDMALRDSLNLKPGTLLEPMMLTPLQQELLRQDAIEMEIYFEQSPRLKSFLKMIRPQESSEKLEINKIGESGEVIESPLASYPQTSNKNVVNIFLYKRNTSINLGGDNLQSKSGASKAMKGEDRDTFERKMG